MKSIDKFLMGAIWAISIAPAVIIILAMALAVYKLNNP